MHILVLMLQAARKLSIDQDLQVLAPVLKPYTTFKYSQQIWMAGNARFGHRGLDQWIPIRYRREVCQLRCSRVVIRSSIAR
jgi:hypothetical protein